MKNLFLGAIITLFCITDVNAQDVVYGVKAGVNLASFKGDGSSGLDGRTSFHLGLVSEILISEVFTLQPELLYSSQGAKGYNSLVDWEYDYKLNYLTIPIMAKYYFAEEFSIEAGPQVGVLLSAKEDYVRNIGGNDVSGTDDIKENVNGIDFGFSFGLGYKMQSGLNFNARYNLGLSNVWEDAVSDDSVNPENAVFQFSVGYYFY